MTTQHDKPKRWQLSLRGLFACVLIAGLCGGWWVDHRRLSQKIYSQSAELDEWEMKRQHLIWAAHSNPPPRLDDVMRLLDVDSGGRVQTRDWNAAPTLPEWP